jgi:hypothetical protein
MRGKITLTNGSTIEFDDNSMDKLKGHDFSQMWIYEDVKIRDDIDIPPHVQDIFDRLLVSNLKTRAKTNKTNNR